MLNCEGSVDPDLINKIEKHYTNKSINAACCVSYEINWWGYQTEDIFCSKSQSQKKCTAEVEIFKKSLMEKCISVGVKEFFKDLSKFDFDINNWLAKASSLDKIRSFNTFRVLKEQKILNFRNKNHFSPIRKYLELFAKFMPTYYPLLEKHGKNLKKIYNKNKPKGIAAKENMTTLKDDLYDKVIENLTSQSLNEIPDDIKEVVKRAVNKFDKFFDELMSKGKNIDLKIFTPFEKTHKKMGDKEFVSKLSTNLVKFLEDFKNDKPDGKGKINILFIFNF